MSVDLMDVLSVGRKGKQWAEKRAAPMVERTAVCWADMKVG